MKQFLPAVAALAVVLHLAGCDAESPAEHDAVPTVAASVAAPIAASAGPAAPPAPGATATQSSGPVPASSNDAVDPGTPEEMLMGWRQALETHAYPIARSYFGDHGTASGMSLADFVKAWDKYRIIDITLGKGRTEGAAGSLYYEAPVTITGLTRQEKPYHLSGTITAKRVNDVPGATADQLRWHIASSTLKP